MTLPTRDEMLAQVDVRFRELAPTAPPRLDPDDASHAEMIQQWHAAHHEVLSRLTNEAFFSFYPQAPQHLEPSDPSHATYIEYWKDISEQIDSGQPGRYDWTNMPVASTSATPTDQEEAEQPAQDGSVFLEDRISYVLILMEAYVEAVAATPLAAKIAVHTAHQIEALRGLVRDGTFATYEHWWRSPSYNEVLYDEDDSNEQIAFVRDLTLEAKIDRSTGSLDTHLAGWASDLRNHNYFGRESMTGG